MPYLISEQEKEEIIGIAHRLADAASQKIMPWFRNQEVLVENKAKLSGVPDRTLPDAFDPVTVADQEAEQAMREILAQERPGDGIIGEEFGVIVGKSGLRWILDPIDGTRAFMIGAPSWGVLIACSDGSRPVFGLIVQPYTGERWEGGLGCAWHHDRYGKTRLHTRGTCLLKNAVLASTFPEIGSAEERSAFERVAAQVMLTRYGMDCYAYGLLALGQIDLVIEAGLNAYDIAAPAAIVEAAGGVISDWSGGIAYEGGRVIAAANAEIHHEALQYLNSLQI